MFSPFFPPPFWLMALSLPVFLAVWWLGRHRPWTWRVNLALLMVAAIPLAIAAGWLFWFNHAMSHAGYTDLVDPARLEDLQLASIFYAVVLSGTLFMLFLVRGLILLRRKAMAGRNGGGRA